MKTTTNIDYRSFEEIRGAGEDELKAFRKSWEETTECAQAIKDGINAGRHVGFTFDTEFVGKVIEDYGYERVAYLLASLINEEDWDLRYSPANKAWASGVEMSRFADNNMTAYRVLSTCHPCILDAVAEKVRKYAA